MNNHFLNRIKDYLFDIPSFHSFKNMFFSFTSKVKPPVITNSIRDHRNYYVFSIHPLIIFTSEHISEIKEFSKIIGKNKKAYFFIYFWWTLYDSFNTIKNILHYYKIHQNEFPNHRITFLINDINEIPRLNRFQLPIKFLHQNSFVDINIFKPIQMEKEYNIIYNARIEDNKRHYLLNECTKIGLISAFIHDIDEHKIEYLEYLKKLLPDALLLNYKPPQKLRDFNLYDGPPQLKEQEICKMINKARVGVILSAKEGACYASIEYLLSGLPVVSTINIGGRNHFFDKRFCRIVPSHPKRIREAIDELISLDISPHFIQKETIKKMKTHIVNIKSELGKIYKSNNVYYTKVENDYERYFVNKMIINAQPFPKNFINDIK